MTRAAGGAEGVAGLLVPFFAGDRGAGVGAPGTEDDEPKPFSERIAELRLRVPGICLDPPLRTVAPGAASPRALSSGSWYTAPGALSTLGSVGRAVCAAAGVASTAQASSAMHVTAKFLRLPTPETIDDDARGAADDVAAVPSGEPPAPSHGGTTVLRDFGDLAPTVAALLFIALAIAFEGGFALRHWAPVGIFVVVLLAACRRRRLSGNARIACALLWAFAVWTTVSVLWADVPGAAFEGGAQNLFYAALFALPLVTLPDREAAGRVGVVLAVVLFVITAVTFVALALSGPGMFLAGRLDEPVEYRNGTAALFAMAFWPLVCVAASHVARTPWRAGAFAAATVALGLAYMTQSRGVALGLGLGAVVALGLGPDRLRRAWLAIVAVGIVAVASHELASPYRAFGRRTALTDHLVGHVVVVLALAGAVAFAFSLAVALFDRGLRAQQRPLRQVRRAAGIALAATVVLAGAAAVVRVGDPVSYASDKYDEFRGVVQGPALGTPRLGSTSGPRYDLWRVALTEFEDAPVIGVGKASYRDRYLARRRNDRNVSDAHSLPFALLAETGIVGFGLFLGFLVAVGLALARGWRLAGPNRWRVSAALAAAAVVLGQASVDFLWLIPGLAGIALLALGVAVAAVHPPAEEPTAGVSRSRTWPATLGLAVCALLIGSVFLSDFYVRKARSADAAQPAARLSAARTA
ncbi:MAG: hypothetical protein QOF76_2113, partial [Solirubrobacteraceae bacterium]|nr:hypothetical protein [Solirubrobacteraceae bacterium]